MMGDLSAFAFLVLERDFHLTAVGCDLAIFDHEVLLNDFGNPQVSERFCGALDSSLCGLSQESELVPTNSMTL